MTKLSKTIRLPSKQIHNILMRITIEIYNIDILQQGIVYDDLKKYGLTIQDYRSAIQYQPNDPLYNAELGFTYYTLKELPESREQLKKALDILQNLTPIKRI
ncbi:unnamed protein product [Paramecium sonneborni]|uniref:Uncharacterized protein n=1 Tax=Paramecium sonneborni TaxID=65129 RepID=A0A8S1RNM7_9CILI|nr:unnamed protein product [Paramecium sonneborni]